MSKLYFTYSAMNAGKSAILLQAAYNYRERGMEVMLWTSGHSSADRLAGMGEIESRIGLKAPAHLYRGDTDLYAAIQAQYAATPISAVFLDEAQFLTKAQVWQLARIGDALGLPVLCYGLRTDFQGELFPGSAALLGIGDALVELKAVCHCGRKATMNLRVGADGMAVKEGAQTEIGGNDRYVALCRRHFSAALTG